MDKCKCSAVIDKAWGKTCSRVGSHEHMGKMYCKLHHPPSLQEKFERQQREKVERWEREKVENDLQAQKHALEKLHQKIGELVMEACTFYWLGEWGDSMLMIEGYISTAGLGPRLALLKEKKRIREAT